MPPAGPRPGLRLTHALAADFDGRSEASLHPDLRVFTGDLVRPHGLALREDLLCEGVGHSYGEMGEALLGEALRTGALAADDPVDLLILAFSAPDVRPGAPASLYLSRHCPGTPAAFAVCDQGSAAAFTALRIAAAHCRTGSCRRAVVVLAEQSALHYEPAEEVELPERHRAVLLVGEAGAGPGLTVGQWAESDGERALKSVRAAHEELGPGAGLLVAGGLVREAAPDTLPGAEAGDAGQPFTGVWSLLAERLADRTEGAAPLLLADHDRRLGRLSTLALP
ncbi:hypothetical protein ACWGB8_36060 [Kitasatospora sp. NPDC054939]